VPSLGAAKLVSEVCSSLLRVCFVADAARALSRPSRREGARGFSTLIAAASSVVLMWAA
jgi:hypothetical protein